MKKKTKRMLGVGAASAAAFAAGIIISATPAYAEEECMCEPDNHVEDCSCECGEAAAAVREAENMESAARTNVIFTEREESYSKKAAEDAEKEKNDAEGKMNDAKAEYDSILAGEEASVKAQKEQAEADAQAKSDALTEAKVKEGQAESAANEAQAEADAAKAELDKAIGYRDGTLPIEDTEEYKNAQQIQADLDKKTAERDAAQDKADKAKSDADEKEKALSAAQADHDTKKVTADEKQKAQDEAQTAKDAAQETQTANEQALNKAAEEKAAADKDVTDKAAEKETTDKAKEDTDKAYEEAQQTTKQAEDDKAAAEKAVEDYKEKNENTLAFFEWLSTNQNVSEAVREDAKNAVDILKGGSGTLGLREKTATVAELLEETNIGKKYDSTSLENFINIVNYVKEGNELRKLEAQERNTDIPELLISSELTAAAQMQLNWSFKDNGKHYDHARTYGNIAENLNIGYNATWDTEEDLTAFRYDESAREMDKWVKGGPYSGWYSKEKYYYNHPELEGVASDYKTGHYENHINSSYLSTGFAQRQQDAGAVFGEGLNGTMYNVFGQTFSSSPKGIPVDEYAELISEYKAKVDEEREKLDKAVTDATKKLEEAKTDEADKKQAVENAKTEAEAAKAALETAEATQREKHTAYGNAVAAEAKSRNDLQTAQTALDKAKQENEAAQAAFTDAQAELENAKSEKEAADTALDQANRALEEKKDAYNKAKEADEAADKVLAALMDVDTKQAVYDTAAAIAKEASDAYDNAKKDTETAQAAYDDAQRAVEYANRLKAGDAQAVKDALAVYEKAQNDYNEKTAAAIEMQNKYEMDKENSAIAKAALEEAQEALGYAQGDQQRAFEECNAKYYMSDKYRNIELSLGLKFTDEAGNPVEGVKVTMYSTGEDDNGNKIKKAAVIVSESDKDGLAYASVYSEQQYIITAIELPDGYSLADKDANGTKWTGEMNISFIEYFGGGRAYPSMGDRGIWVVKAVTDLSSDVAEKYIKDSGSSEGWEGGGKEARLGIVVVKDPVNEASDISDEETDPSVGVLNQGNTSSHGGTTMVVKRKVTSSNSVGTSGGNVITASKTGDAGYGQIAGYTILALAAGAGIVVALKRKNRSGKVN